MRRYDYIADTCKQPKAEQRSISPPDYTYIHQMSHIHSGIPQKRNIWPTRTDERHNSLTQLHKRANGVTGMLIITHSHIKRLNSTRLVGWQNIHKTQCPPHPVPSPEGKHNKRQKPLLRKIRKTVCTGHAPVARRRQQGYESPAYLVDATSPWPPNSAPPIEHSETAPQTALLPSEMAPDQTPPA